MADLVLKYVLNDVLYCPDTSSRRLHHGRALRLNEGAGTPLTLNLRRRHLDESQRAMVAKRVATMRQGERNDLPAEEGRLSQEQAAALLNVSVRSVERASKVIDRGAPELIKAVDGGRISVVAAAEIAKKPQAEQQEIVKLPTPKEARKEARPIKREPRRGIGGRKAT